MAPASEHQSSPYRPCATIRQFASHVCRLLTTDPPSSATAEVGASHGRGENGGGGVRFHAGTKIRLIVRFKEFDMPKSVKGPPLRQRRRIARYTPATVRKVCEDLASGKTYQEVGRDLRRPSMATLYNWRQKHPEFAEAADAARAFGAEFCADRALEVAEQATEETVRKAKLHVDTLMQRAASLAPERWSGRAASRSMAKAEPLEIVFSVRHFEKVIGPDGKAYVREILPEGEG